MDLFKVKKTRDFGTLINDSFQYVRRYSNSLGKGILYYVVPFICLSLIFTYQYTAQLQSISSGNPGNFNFGLFVDAYSPVMLLALLTSAALASVVLYHMKLVADEGKDNTNITAGDLWEGVKSNFLIVLALNLVVGVASGIGMVFFVIPGVYIAIKLSLVPAVYILEDTSMKEAFSRSWNLVKSYWWQTFFLVLLMAILIAIMSWGIGLIFGLLGYLAGFIGFSNPHAAFQSISSVVSSLSNVLYVLLYACFGLHLYNLIERKEGEGLAEEIDSIA